MRLRVLRSVTKTRCFSTTCLDHEEQDLGFTAPKDAASVIPNYSAELLSHEPLGGRLFTALPSDKLDIGMTVLVFGFEATTGESAATMVGIAAGYLVVNRLTDGSCDAVRARLRFERTLGCGAPTFDHLSAEV